MSDELAIQPQIIQPQKKDNSLMYATGLGTLGGVGGYYAADKWTGKYASHEDIIKDAKDSTDFSTKYANAGEATIKGVTDKAKEVKEAEAALAEAQKPVADPNNADVKKYNEAVSKRDAEFNRLMEIEKKKVNRGGGLASDIPSRKALKEALTTSEMTQFNPYLQRYENARRALIGTPGSKFSGGSARSAYQAIGTAKSDVERMYNDIFNHFNSLSDKKKNKFDPEDGRSKKLIEAHRDAVLPKGGYGSRSYADFKALNDRFGEGIFEFVTEKPESQKGKQVYKLTNPKGKSEWVIIDNDALKAKRESLFKEYAENVNRYIELAKEEGEFSKNFWEANKDILKNDLRTPIRRQADLARLPKPSVFKAELLDIELAEQSISKKKIKFPITAEIGGHTYSFRTEHDLEVFKMKTQAGLDVSTRMHQEAGKIKKQITEMLRQDPAVGGAYKKFARTIGEDKGIKNALDKIERELNGKYSTETQKALYGKIKGMVGETAGLSEAEVEAKAKEAVEKIMKDGSFEKAVADAKPAYEKALAESGKVDADAVKKAQEALDGKKGELDKLAKELAEKLGKTGGMNKWLGAGIGLAALGIAGYMAGKPSDS